MTNETAAQGATIRFPETATGEKRPKNAHPVPSLGVFSAVAITVGIVVGAGIFRTPALVAANAGSEWNFVAAWILGGAFSLVGALCYAELTTAFPSAGGDYHFLRRAFGGRLAFMFAWARIAVIQTGSLALLAFVFGDYARQIFDFGSASSAVYAGAAVVLLTLINVAGVRQGTMMQNVLTVLEVGGVLLVALAGLYFTSPPTEAAGIESGNTIAAASSASASFGLTMVFVLLTFGGWNEAAYVSSELRSARRRMATVLIASILVITALYLLINLAYLRALGLAGMAASEAVAADAMRAAFGASGAVLISLLVAVSAVTSANATIFTGARTNYALGRDFPAFSFLGKWNEGAGTPVNALVVQGAIALLLIALGALTRDGFAAIVEYTAPVFWFFFLLVGIALFVLRRTESNVERPFRVPLYPLTPILFCLTSLYLLYSSLAYTGAGAFVGAGILIAGAVLQFLLARRKTAATPAETVLDENKGAQNY